MQHFRIQGLPAEQFAPLFLPPPAEGRDHFLFLDARRGVAAFAKILLLGAIAHHAGMRHF